MASTTHILIVDDHPIVRQGYYDLISRHADLKVCGQAETESEALAAARRLNPHLAIIDITLGDGNGIDLIKQLRASQPNLKMLAVSAHDEMLFARRALNAGALGYINKKAAIDHLITAIRQVLDDEVYVSEAVKKRLLKGLAATKGEVRQRDPIEGLSDRELEAFEMIGMALTTREVAERMHVSRKTVERFRENIKNKLGLDNAAQLLQRATQWVLENR